MNDIVNIEPIIVLGDCVCLRSEQSKAFADMSVLARFADYRTAVMAIKILRTPSWMRAGELMLDDEDFLTLQVLARRLVRIAKDVANVSIPTSHLRFGAGQNDNTGVSLEDLL